METVTSKITYGITQTYNGDYALTSNIVPAQWDNSILLGSVSYDLRYKRLEFALKKADSFYRTCYKDFINFQGKQIHFVFENLGLIKLGKSEVK